MKNALLITLSMAVVFLSGCATEHKSDLDKVQGQWAGHELTGNSQGTSSLTISGNNLDFRSEDKSEWYKGTATFREDTTPKQFFFTINDCPDAQVVGKTAPGIYRIEDGALYISALGPDATAPPSSFDAPGARQFVFKRK
ncbi:MAG: hypothetical protein ABSG59_01275 [Verrucomicrobiota bacterium]|jgi:uncharacterized protein (TIGR03067 family)